MMDKIKTIIWYGFVAGVLLLFWNLGSNYSIGVVEEGFTAMQPTIDPKSVHFLDRSNSTLLGLKRDDIIAFQMESPKREPVRAFGRVVGTPGMTVSVRNSRILVDGSEVANATLELAILKTGLLIPRDHLFVVFDQPGAVYLTIPQRLIPYRRFLGRVMGK